MPKNTKPEASVALPAEEQYEIASNCSATIADYTDGQISDVGLQTGSSVCCARCGSLVTVRQTSTAANDVMLVAECSCFDSGLNFNLDLNSENQSIDSEPGMSNSSVDAMFRFDQFGVAEDLPSLL